MITVWGRTTSINVQAVMWAIGELGLAHERLDFGGAFGKTDTPEYFAMNPNRLVPVVRDGDGPFLWESASIVRYLSARYGDATFWPTDPLARADLDKWAEWSKTSFANTMLTGLFGPIWRTPEAERNLAAITAAEARMKTLAAMIDARLGNGPWLAGETFTFADIEVGVPLYRYFNLPFDRAERPNLGAYYDRLAARPAYAEHVMVSFESLRAR
jgi:glutathione S-transferase